jgi:uncharacterized LabA/DUF88 family protein
MISPIPAPGSTLALIDPEHAEPRGFSFLRHCSPTLTAVLVDIAKKHVDCGSSELALWRRSFHQCLRSLRKVALRFGHIPTTHVHWQLTPEALKALINGQREWESITDQDFLLDLRQKGVDMRIGLDIASLTYEKQVNQIVLISGDSDFVPAAKLARRGGIDFVLDPMWSTIRPDLHEHIDGLRCACPRPKKSTVKPS